MTILVKFPLGTFNATNKILVVKLDGYAVDKNLTGLVANQLMAKYQRPCCLLTRTNRNGKETYEGSMRGYTK